KSRDLTVTSVNPPSAIECEEPTIPIAVVKNVGFSTITGFNVSYSIDNGAPSNTTITGVSLAPDAQMSVPLNTFTPSGGQHVITVYSAQPVSSTGTGDENVLNDTLRKSFYTTGKVSAPVTQGFEDATFPPATWSIENPDGGITWERTTAAAKTGTASMVISNYDNPSLGTTDNFVSSVVTGTAAYDSMYVSFDYAYAMGSSSTLADTLALMVTTDCGQTFTTVWQKWGAALQTAISSGGGGFVPGSGDWSNVNLNLFKYVNTQDFQMYFEDKGNHQNNVYIDNINIYGINVPARLKKQGYLIYPNPFRQQFIVRNYEVPVNLESVRVYNTMGQLVWSQQYSGNASTEISVDMSNAPAGVYYVKLFYTDKSVVQKVVKQ
ncbi:MAG TPA: T9SS type A sorting domain-containing protein, partial [Hanamia sp.]